MYFLSDLIKEMMYIPVQTENVLHDPCPQIFFFERFESAVLMQKQSCSNTRADLTCLWLNSVGTAHSHLS